MDLIRVEGIRVIGRHGADPGERDTPQPFDVTVELEADLEPAARSDELKQTVNYALVRERVGQIVETTSFRLIERLASEIAHAVCEDTRVAKVAITIAKPGILAGATPSVTLRRDNPKFQPWRAPQ